MKNHPYIRNFSAFAIATAIMPALLYASYSIFWPYSFGHLFTRMVPVTLASLLFYIMANLLSYCDLKDSTYKCYSYVFNFLAIWYPATSFAMHSNLQVLENSKVLYEYKMAAGNMLIALLVAEFTRVYLANREKKSLELELSTEEDK